MSSTMAVVATKLSALDNSDSTTVHTEAIEAYLRLRSVDKVLRRE
jgi:hypothetical protein